MTSPISEAAVPVAQITLDQVGLTDDLQRSRGAVTYCSWYPTPAPCPDVDHGHGPAGESVRHRLLRRHAAGRRWVHHLATYTTTQTDLDAGHVYNKGTVTGSTSTGATVSDTSEVTVSATQNPNITVEKSTTTGAFAGPGSVVTFSYLVRNTGNVSLQGVSVVDPMPGLSPLSCPTTQLAVGNR
ncbi:MAG: hypothetical protein IPM11_14200 [Micropruina sp.]|nr:hypothetical protein [Micropruina sp.]